MFRAGRSVLFILSFLSLQLTLISGGERCPVVSLFAQSGSATPGMDMASMDMASMDMASTDEGSPQRAGDQSDAASSHHDRRSCDANASRANCDSMTVCVFAAETAPVGVRNPQRLPAVRAPMLAMRTPPTEGAAPDLPPPRLQS